MPADLRQSRCERTNLVEKTEAHVVILGLLLLLLLGSLGGGLGVTASRSGASSGASRGVLVGVGDAVLELSNLLPLVTGLNGDRDDLLVGVDNGVHNGGQGREVGSQRDGGNGGDGRRESLQQLGLLDVKNAGSEGVAVVVDLVDTHTVGEGRDVQHVEQGSLGSTDLAASLNELEVGGDFDGTTGNLGGDTKSLEERCLTRLHTSVTSGNEDITGGDGTGTGRGGDTVGEDLVTDVLELAVGEDETDVACSIVNDLRRHARRAGRTLDVGKETLVLGGLVDETLERTADHGVLAHQDNTLTAEGLTDLVHLLRRDIVDGDDEDGGVLLEESLKLLEVDGLGFFLAPHCVRCDAKGCLRS